MQSPPQNGGGYYQRPPHVPNHSSYPSNNAPGGHPGMRPPYNNGRGGGSFPPQQHDPNPMSRGNGSYRPYNNHNNNNNNYASNLPPQGSEHGVYVSDAGGARGGGYRSSNPLMSNNHPGSRNDSAPNRYHAHSSPNGGMPHYEPHGGAPPHAYGTRTHAPTHPRDLDDYPMDSNGGGGMYRGGTMQPPSLMMHPVEPPRAPPRPLPPVTYVETQDELLEACTALTKCRVISLEPHLSKSAGGEISLLAMAPDDDSCVYVIDVPKIQRVYVYKYLHPVLSDAEITTLVYDIERVGPALIQGLGFSFARLIDLQSLSLAVEWVMYGVNRLRTLDAAVENVLQMTAKPNSMLSTEREILEGGLDVWDERPVRDALREYAAYAVIHYFHLYRALRSKEREAEAYSMRIKDHRSNQCNATGANENGNVFTGGMETIATGPTKETISNETLRELIGEPGVCPLCKHEGHVPIECRKSTQHVNSSQAYSSQGNAPPPYAHRGFQGGNTASQGSHYPSSNPSYAPRENGMMHPPPPSQQHRSGAYEANMTMGGSRGENYHSSRGAGPYPYGSGNHSSSYARDSTAMSMHAQHRAPTMGGADRGYRSGGNRDPSSGPYPQPPYGNPYLGSPRGPPHPSSNPSATGGGAAPPRAGYVVCEACNKPGHTAETCFQLKPELAQTLTVSCTHCGMPGHREPRCFDKYPHLRNPDGVRSGGGYHNPSTSSNNGSGGPTMGGGPRIYQCSHCGRIGHTVDRCHILYPELRKRTSRGDDSVRGVRQHSPGRDIRREEDYNSSNANNAQEDGSYVPSASNQDQDDHSDPSPKRRYY